MIVAGSVLVELAAVLLVSSEWHLLEFARW